MKKRQPYFSPLGRILSFMALVVSLWGGAYPLAAHGQSVKLPNGEYTESMVDMRIKVLGGNVDFLRTWQNGRWYVNPAWATLEFIQDPLDKSVKTIDRAGALYVRVQAGITGVYAFGGDVMQRVFITQTATGWRWNDRAGNWINYDKAGRITAYGDHNNVTVSFDIDATGQRTAVKDHFGSVVATFAYQNDRLTSVSDTTGRQVAYEWSGDRLTRITDVRGGYWLYQYDGNGQLIQRTSPTGAVISLAYADGKQAGPPAMDSGKNAGQSLRPAGIETTNPSTVSAVNYAGRVGKMVDALGGITFWNTAYDRTTRKYTIKTDMPDQQTIVQEFDSAGRQVSRSVNGIVRSTLTRDGAYVEKTTNERGLVTEERFDTMRQLVKRIHPDGTSVMYSYDGTTGRVTSEVNEAGISTSHLYDTHGNRTQTMEAGGTPAQRTTQWTYDAYGQALTQTLQNGATTLTRSMAYDAKGNLSSVTDEEGATTRYNYNVRGQVANATNALGQTWLLEYDAAGNRTKITDPLGHSTAYAFDAQGRVTQAKDALGNTTRVSYNPQGQPLQITNALLGEHRYSYDISGRLLRQTSPSGLAVLREYDVEGRLAKLTDAAGNVSTLEYVNAANGLRGVLTAVNFPTYREEYRYDLRNRPTMLQQMVDAQTQLTTRLGYDAMGRVTSRTEPDGTTTLLQYDALGRLVQHTDAMGAITRQQLDVRGNPVAFTDPSGSTHRFTYDKVGRLLREERPAGGTTVVTYDAAGQATRRTQPAGNLEDYQYDTAGRLQRITYTPAGQATPSHTVLATYDLADWLQELNTSASATSPAIQQRYTRDALGRVTQEQTTYGSDPSAIHASLAYSYNPDGATTGTTYPDGSSASYAYNKGQLQSATTPTGQSIQWNAYTLGQPTQASYPGVNRSQSYDPLLRPLLNQLSPAAPAAPGLALMERALQYDPASRIIQRGTEAGAFNYTYDKASRLTGATPPVALQSLLPTEAYTYDATGNRTSSAHQPGAWATNAEHQLLQWGSAANQVNLQYNPNGNLQTQTVGGQTRTHSYDAADRLVEVKDNAGKSAQYSYDPQGRRIRKTVGSKTTWYLYSPQGLIAEISDAGKVEKAYGWEPDTTWGTAPLWQATTSNGQLNNAATADVHYLHSDHLGTVQMATDSAGQISWKGQAQAFGKVELDPSNRITMNLRFPGQYYDQETGTHYNWMRDYSISTGRYLQRDPIGLEGGNNPFAYVGGNPVSKADPRGLWSVDVGGFLGGGVNFSFGYDEGVQRGFFSMQFGYGVGGGIMVAPDGGLPTGQSALIGCDGDQMFLEIFGKSSVSGLGANVDIVTANAGSGLMSKRPYSGLSWFDKSFGKKWGIKAEAAGGVQMTAVTKPNSTEKCGCR